MSIVLEAHGIRKQFPGVLANDDVSFDLKKGEISRYCWAKDWGREIYPDEWCCTVFTNRTAAKFA
jgi:hypothetical protein